jgi:MPBQ/MSBQ methyltransferase
VLLMCCLCVEGDAEDLPFETDSKDRYVSAGSIEYWPDPQVLLMCC